VAGKMMWRRCRDHGTVGVAGQMMWRSSWCGATDDAAQLLWSWHSCRGRADDVAVDLASPRCCERAYISVVVHVVVYEWVQLQPDPTFLGTRQLVAGSCRLIAGCFDSLLTIINTRVKYLTTVMHHFLMLLITCCFD